MLKVLRSQFFHVTDSGDGADTDDNPTSLHYVGPVTAEILETVGVTTEDVRTKSVSYTELVEAGVNPGVAAKIRREHSLPWSLDGFTADLDSRSDAIRGLTSAEREWVAQSDDDDWEPSKEAIPETVDPGPEPEEAAIELPPSDREIVSLATINEIEQETQETLADAGVTTARSLASIEPSVLAEATEIPEQHIRELQATARGHLE